MVCTKKEQSPKCQVYVNGTQIERKDSLTHLGSLVTSDGRSNKDVSNCNGEEGLHGIPQCALRSKHASWKLRRDC